MEFKHWFVENENNLQSWLSGSTVNYIVYHGTNQRPFDQFNYQKSQRYVLFSAFDVEAKGFFFSESPHDALSYGPNVVACYVRLINPLVDPRRDKHMGVDKFDRTKEMHLLKILGPLVQRDPRYGPYIDLGVRRVWIQDRKYSSAHDWIYDAVGYNGLDWDALDNPQVIDRMKKLGYDGTFVEESENKMNRSIFVLSPDQIKMVKWVTGPQAHWGDPDEYYTNKVDGRRILVRPDHPSLNSASSSKV